MLLNLASEIKVFSVFPPAVPSFLLPDGAQEHPRHDNRTQRSRHRGHGDSKLGLWSSSLIAAGCAAVAMAIHRLMLAQPAAPRHDTGDALYGVRGVAMHSISVAGLVLFLSLATHLVVLSFWSAVEAYAAFR